MSEKRAVLVIEPSRSIVDALESVADVSPDWEQNPTRALETLRAGRHDVVLVAASLDGQRGADFIREAAAVGCRIPLILAATDLEDDDCKAALDAGASTCVDLTAGTSTLAWAIRFASTRRSALENQHERLLADLGSFLAHEGKNAVAGVGGAIQVIADRLAPGGVEHVICAEIRDRLRAFKSTIDTLTFLLRPSKTSLVRSRVNARALVASVAEDIGREVKVSGDEVDLSGDRSQLQRLVEALLQNASEATNEEATIQVALLVDGAECVLEVLDTGPGVPSSDLSRVLNLFYTTKRGQPGLGLSVAKQIAEEHGGSLELCCVAGSGLRVKTRLPIYASDE